MKNPFAESNEDFDDGQILKIMMIMIIMITIIMMTIKVVE